MKEYRVIVIRVLDTRDEEAIISLVNETNERLCIGGVFKSSIQQILRSSGTIRLGNVEFGKWTLQVTDDKIPILCYSLDLVGTDHRQTIRSVSYLLRQASSGVFHAVRLVPFSNGDWDLFGVSAPVYVGRIDGQFIVHSVLTPNSSNTVVEMRRVIEAARLAGLCTESSITIRDDGKEIVRFLLAFHSQANDG